MGELTGRNGMRGEEGRGEVRTGTLATNPLPLLTISLIKKTITVWIEGK